MGDNTGIEWAERDVEFETRGDQEFSARLFRAGCDLEDFYGGASIFSLTPTTLEVVNKMNAPYRPALSYTRSDAERDGVIDRDDDGDGDDIA